MASTIASTLAVAAAVTTTPTTVVATVELAMAVPTVAAVAATAVAVAPAAPTMAVIKAKMNPPCTAFPCLLLSLFVILFRLVLINLFRLSRSMLGLGQFPLTWRCTTPSSFTRTYFCILCRQLGSRSVYARAGIFPTVSA